MLFNSLPFLAFIALFFVLWPIMQKRNTSKWLWICFMSFVFYGWWDWRFLFLLLGTGAIDYLSGYYIAKDKAKKAWLWFSLASNIGSLLIFKYSNWLASSLDAMFSARGIVTHFRESIPEFTLVLPVGISFYTFNSMSYTIDLYKGKTVPAKNMLHFFAFISFFPHLVAGPIIRARDILQQLSADKKADAVEILNGLKTCIWGFFQKMVLADNLAVFVNEKFNHVQDINDALSWWVCMLGFSFQIYFDFNGYSTIARGIAKLCGIHFRLNFNHPYRAVSFGDFWERWHISLSRFFRDYVYIPLGGNRRSATRNIMNRWLTMLLSGLWHGANFTFIVWGALHAFYLSAEKGLSRLGLKNWPATGKWIYRAVVFVCVVIAWVFFRADNVNDAWFIVRSMLMLAGASEFRSVLGGGISLWLLISMMVEWGPKRYLVKYKYHPVVEICFWSVLVAVIIYFRGPEQQFIYFQF